MSAFTVAAELLGDMELTPGQLAQLRALDMGYQQRLYTVLLEAGHVADATGVPAEPEREVIAALRESLEMDVLAMLTPAQHDTIRRP